MSSTHQGRPAKSDADRFTPISALIPKEVKSSLEKEAFREGRPISEIIRRKLCGETHPEQNGSYRLSITVSLSDYDDLRDSSMRAGFSVSDEARRRMFGEGDVARQHTRPVRIDADIISVLSSRRYTGFRSLPMEVEKCIYDSFSDDEKEKYQALKESSNE